MKIQDKEHGQTFESGLIAVDAIERPIPPIGQGLGQPIQAESLAGESLFEGVKECGRVVLVPLCLSLRHD